MALSGSTSKIYSSKNSFWVWVEWTATQNIANNTSTITAITYGGTNSYGYYTGSNNGSNITINGATTSVGDSGDVGANTTKRELCRRTEVVEHNADGTKSVTISGRWWYSGSIVFDLTSSGTFTLDTIPRASSISSISGGALGSPVTVNISRASTSFTHTVIYKRTDGVDVTVGTSQGTSCTFTPALSDAQFLPNTTSGTATIIVHTYNGGSYIGTATRTFTVTVPASVVPTVSIATAGVDQYNGYYVQGRSKVTVTLSAAGAQGSSISSRSTVVRYGSTNISASNNNSFTSGVLNYSGTITIDTTVTDSRGRSASSSTTISVVAYAVPSVTGFSAYRSNADGNANAQGVFMRISGTGSIASINSTNEKNTVIRYRERGASTWINAASNSTSYSPSLNAVVAADANKSYEAQIVVADYFTSSTQLIDIGTAFVLMDFHSSGTGIAIGKVAEGNGVLDIAGPVYHDGKSIEDKFQGRFMIEGGGVRYIKIAELTTSVGSSWNMFSAMIDGLGDFGSPTACLDFVRFATRGSVTVACRRLEVSANLAGASYAYRNNATGLTELWIKTAPYNYPINVLVMIAKAGTGIARWGNLDLTTVEPTGLNYITPTVIT